MRRKAVQNTPLTLSGCTILLRLKVQGRQPRQPARGERGQSWKPAYLLHIAKTIRINPARIAEHFECVGQLLQLIRPR